MSKAKPSICQLSEIVKMKLWAKHEEKHGKRHKAIVLAHVVTRMELRKAGLQI